MGTFTSLKLTLLDKSTATGLLLVTEWTVPGRVTAAVAAVLLPGARTADADVF